MQLTNGNLLWSKENKILNTYPYLSKNIECDVLVIGGGITGAITSYFLYKEGFDVTVIEKNIIGYGSTLATTALLEYQIDEDLIKLKEIIGENSAKRIYELCYDAVYEMEKICKEIDCDFEIKDCVYYTNSLLNKQSMAREYKERKKAGFDVKFIENFSIPISSAILSSKSSAVIDPYLFTQKMFKYLKDKGVNIYESTRAENFDCQYDNVIVKTNNNFEIDASRVIFATGFETLKYIDTDIVNLVKTFTIVTNKQKGIDTSYTARDTVSPYHYTRFYNDKIIYGGEDVKITNKMVDEEYLKKLTNNKHNKLYSSLVKLYPDKDLDVEEAFAGTFADTIDTLPIIDEIPNMNNCFCNLGFGANGILYSVIGGEILKEAVKGLYTKEIKMFKINRKK